MATIDEKTSRLIEIARAYYSEDRTQEEIAKNFGITRSQVSRYLKEAREMGIVQFRIVVPGDQNENLINSLKHRFPHLKDVVIAPVFTEEIDSTRAIVGRYAANYLMENLQPSQKIALGCGRTLREVVNFLKPTEIVDTTVVQAMGNLGHEAHGIDYTEIAKTAASAFGAKLVYISSPAILGKGSVPAWELISTNPTIKKGLDLAKSADVYIVGIGSLESDLLYVQVGMIDEAEMVGLSKSAAGDICGRFYDQNGGELKAPFDERTVGIELQDLKRAERSIGVACGPDKVAPLIGALRGEFINVVISDENTLKSVIALHDVTR